MKQDTRNFLLFNWSFDYEIHGVGQF